MGATSHFRLENTNPPADFQTPRGFFYHYEKKEDSDPHHYKSYSAAKSHIALLGDAVCLDRISIGFRPRTDSKFIGPITVTRPEAPVAKRVMRYNYEYGEIGPEWIQVYNRAIPERGLSADEATIRGMVLFEEEGMCSLLLFCESQVFA